MSSGSLMPGSPRGNPIEVLGHAVMLVSAFAKDWGLRARKSCDACGQEPAKRLPSQADVGSERGPRLGRRARSPKNPREA